ncbi:hypothetical protein DM02DRAFT_644742 [Periconia macrospinosa]|uniref:Uncharacterized protein n=1 Tax=Periconia macrospinosa TaxID=97972 RepID=A0A2V1DEK2_9PLEO|nr:hypothetical protein DM02DRAFT_644742 [Periconia macrospinosa]
MPLETTKHEYVLESPLWTDALKPSLDGQASIPLLPATFRDKHYEIHVVRDEDALPFLEMDLDVARLNRVHKWMWLVGLPGSPRALHYQILKKRNIVLTEQMDLHLVWSPSRILIKPLPRYLLSPHFWRTNLCPHPHLYRVALGFLLSWIALVERESDFKLAVILGLLPAEMTWPDWLVLAREVMLRPAPSRTRSNEARTIAAIVDNKEIVNNRFLYGELRVGRLNWIYRFRLGYLRGYLSSCTTYRSFLQENVNSLIAIFAYATIVLSAMQVGLGTSYLSESKAFDLASSVFTLFSIFAPLVAVTGIVCVLVVFILYNLGHTIRRQVRRRLQRDGV